VRTERTERWEGVEGRDVDAPQGYGGEVASEVAGEVVDEVIDEVFGDKAPTVLYTYKFFRTQHGIRGSVAVFVGRYNHYYRRFI